MSVSIAAVEMWGEELEPNRSHSFIALFADLL